MLAAEEEQLKIFLSDIGAAAVAGFTFHTVDPFFDKSRTTARLDVGRAGPVAGLAPHVVHARGLRDAHKPAGFAESGGMARETRTQTVLAEHGALGHHFFGKGTGFFGMADVLLVGFLMALGASLEPT